MSLTCLWKKLLIRDQGVSVHRKHNNTLLTEIYKTFSGEKSLFHENQFDERKWNIQSKNIKSLSPNQNK